MNQKKILVILGHPAKESLCKNIAEIYSESARDEDFEVKKIYLGNLNFDLNLKEGHKSPQGLEKELEISQKMILWANHIVFIFPVWWGSAPALLKGFIDRVFLPDFAYKFKDNSRIPERYLKGKTASLIITAGSPRILYFLSNPVKSMMKTFFFKLCGIKLKNNLIFCSINKYLSKERFDKILKKVEKFGKAGA